MKTKLEQKLVTTHKSELKSYLKKHPQEMMELINLALIDKQPYSWRAAWVLWSCMEDNDKRLRTHVEAIIDKLPFRKDNQQREHLIVLQKMDVEDKYIGKLFDTCTEIWKDPGKMPSLRYNAFKLMIKITKRFPDLAGEVYSLTDSKYLDALSHGVKHSINRILNELNLYLKQ